MSAVADRTAWMDDALCANRDPEIWFDDRRAEAKRICAQCPVAQQCRDHGGDEYRGIWGGVKLNRPSPGPSPAIEYLGFPHGTGQGYKQHLREETPPCARCLIAHRYEQQESAAKHVRVKSPEELERNRQRRRERRAALRQRRTRDGIAFTGIKTEGKLA